MATFRRANIALETLFVTRALDGSLRQYYIGRLAAIAGLLARSFLTHPHETLRLAQARATRDHDELLARSEQLFVQTATDCADLVDRVHVPQRRDSAPAPAIRQRHALLAAEGIGHDLPDRFAPTERSALQEWILSHYDELGNALVDSGSRLPVALAALRTTEEKIVLERDMETAPEEMRTRLSRAALAGASGDQRRRRLERMVATLDAGGIAMPQEIGTLLPLWGLEQLLLCAAVLPETTSTVAQAWFERHLPHLAPWHAELTHTHPPRAPGMEYAWAAVRLEPASRYLLLRAATRKPLWQDPYGARHLLNRDLQPLWRNRKPPAELLVALINDAVLGTDFPPQACERVREYLSGRLLAGPSGPGQAQART
jgi:hypothetical protein